MFLTLMVIGLVGLLVMAVPAFARHGAIGHGHGHGVHGVAPAKGAIVSSAGATRFIPSPRLIFSVLALYGAFGNAALHAFHLPLLLAALGAAMPALLVEWGLVRPLWRVLFRVQGAESTPLEQLVLSEARAEVPFRNGRGLVSTVRDGRRVQLAATLRQDQLSVPVKVGDRLTIEEVDPARERVTVTLARD